MMGLNMILSTKQDYINAVRLANLTGEGTELLAARLNAMKNSTNMMELKESSYAKRAETQHQEDYEPIADVNCEMSRLGFTCDEVDALIGELKNA